jgi:hypothetical protein
MQKKGRKTLSTESVALDGCGRGCYIKDANQMMRALQGKLWGALFFLPSLLSSARVDVYGRF